MTGSASRSTVVHGTDPRPVLAGLALLLPVRVSRWVGPVLAGLVLCSCAVVDELNPLDRPGLEFRLANELTPDSKIGDVSVLFKQHLEQASPDGEIEAGEIRVVLYDQGMVGTERQLLENAFFGVMEVVQINSSVVTTIDPAYSLFDLPYIFVSDGHHRAVLNGEIGELFLERLQADRARLLRPWIPQHLLQAARRAVCGNVR